MEEKKDLVNHPDHYTAYGLESLEAIKGSMSRIEYMGFLKGNSLKYMYRYLLKGSPIMDLEKSLFYNNLLKEETKIYLEKGNE